MLWDTNPTWPFGVDQTPTYFEFAGQSKTDDNQIVWVKVAIKSAQNPTPLFWPQNVRARAAVSVPAQRSNFAPRGSRPLLMA